jgi:hypothetical protein
MSYRAALKEKPLVSHNADFRRSTDVLLTAESGMRSLDSSRVAIDRHSSALISGHDGALRVSCPQGNGDKQLKTASADRGRRQLQAARGDLRPLEATAGDRRRARHRSSAEAERTERTADSR